MSNKVKILAIDDEIKALDLFKFSLEAYGFEVLAASDGQAGIEQAISVKPDLIILDIRMPKLDGWDVCRILKQNPLTNRIPIVFLTAYSSVRDKERAKELGVHAYLTKPVNPDNIIMLIESIVASTTSSAPD